MLPGTKAEPRTEELCLLAGDCFVSGFDPPKFAVVLQRQQPEEEGSQPLLKPPHDYKLAWRDESMRADIALHIWLPLPYPG